MWFLALVQGEHQCQKKILSINIKYVVLHERKFLKLSKKLKIAKNHEIKQGIHSGSCK